MKDRDRDPLAKFDKYAMTVPRAAAVLGIASIVGILLWEWQGDDRQKPKFAVKVTNTTGTLVVAPSPTATAPAPIARLATIPPKPAPVTSAVEGTPQQTTTAYNPNVKVLWSFSSLPQTFDCVRAGVRVPCSTFKCADMRGREAPCVEGGLHVAPFADVLANDVARFVMLCGDPGRVCASSNLKLSRGPLDDFRVVVIMHETLLTFPISARMERSGWHRTGAIPEWEKRIDAGALALLGRANEQVGVRTWRPEDAIVLDEVETRRKRRALR